MSGRDEIVLGAISFSPALAPAIIDRMSESIVDLLLQVAERDERIVALEQERDFYKAAATKLMKPCKGRRKQ
jgi:hypothetical protein